MKVILLADVKKLGKKDQTIEVSDGYANNFLFPRHLAVQVTKKSVEVLENQQEARRENSGRVVFPAQEKYLGCNSTDNRNAIRRWRRRCNARRVANGRVGDDFYRVPGFAAYDSEHV